LSVSVFSTSSIVGLNIVLDVGFNESQISGLEIFTESFLKLWSNFLIIVASKGGLVSTRRSNSSLDVLTK
jgi:hypothetical protein